MCDTRSELGLAARSFSNGGDLCLNYAAEILGYAVWLGMGQGGAKDLLLEESSLPRTARRQGHVRKAAAGALGKEVISSES